MRTSLNEIQMIDSYLLGDSSKEQNQQLEVQMIINAELKDKVEAQHEVYEQVKMYGRKMLVSEIESVHQKLFLSPDYSWFRAKIRNLFRKQ